jgi:hypothetical protein
LIGPFYRKATKKSIFLVVAFFFLFAFLQTSATAIQVGIRMARMGVDIRDAYESGEVPEIVIEDGIANVEGPQPYIFSASQSTIIVDTTGGIQEIDTGQYDEGLLLTRTEVHFLGEEGYQVRPLTDFQDIFGDPIVLDKAHVLDLWLKVSLISVLLNATGAFVWADCFSPNVFVRFAYIVIIALLMWAVVSTNRKGVGFSAILIPGIYANVPTWYITFALRLINVKSPVLYLMLLVVIWIIALQADCSSPSVLRE